MSSSRTDHGTYSLANAAEQSRQRFASLEACFDTVTTRHLEEIRVAPGWSCLEVGGGGGSIARWLAERVGPRGRVVVTDIDPQRMRIDRPNTEMRRHDITLDPLEEETFDLVHERLVLVHLPERDRALDRMITALKPGGWLLIEDFDISWMQLTPACAPADALLFRKVIASFHQILTGAGVDPAYGRRFHTMLREHGLIDVHAEGHIQIAAGGSPTWRLHQANVEQLRDRLLRSGLLDDDEIERFQRLVGSPEFSSNYHPFVSARGRRPGRAGRDRWSQDSPGSPNGTSRESFELQAGGRSTNGRPNFRVSAHHARATNKSADARLFELIEGYKGSQVVAAVAELGVADVLAAGPTSSREVARACGADPDAILRLLRCGAAVGLVEEVNSEQFALTEMGTYLRTGERSLRDAATGLTGPTHWQPWSRLADGVRTGQPTAEQTLGCDVMSYAAAHPEESARFARAMSAISSRVSAEVASRYDASRFGRIVDVGGSHGELLAGLLAGAPNATGVLLEVAEVVAGARDAFDGRGLASRVEVVAGDFLNAVPTGADLYVLKSILHGRSDEQALQILRNCHEASSFGGTLLIIEGLLPTDGRPSQIHLMDMAMLLALGGRERTLEDYAALLEQAGYSLERVIPVPVLDYPWHLLEASRR